jgi:hypothetical protein
MLKYNRWPADLEGLGGQLSNGYTVRDNMEASCAALAIAQREGLALLDGTGNPTKTPHIAYTQPWPGTFQLAFYPHGNAEGLNNPTRRIALLVEA